MQKTRRMLSSEIIKCDGFISMSAAAQALYVHLVLSCDDEGFTSSIELCKFMAHATDEDEEMLVKRRFILQIPNENGKVTIIKHWLMSNYAKSGIVQSQFTERSKVFVKPNGNYTLDPEEGKPLPSHASDGHARRTHPADTSATTNSTNSTNRTKTTNSTNRTNSIGIGQPPITPTYDDDDQPF